MKVQQVDQGSIVRTVYNVRAIEGPGGKHPASYWLLMETSDTPVAIGRKFQLLVSQ